MQKEKACSWCGFCGRQVRRATIVGKFSWGVLGLPVEWPRDQQVACQVGSVCNVIMPLYELPLSRIHASGIASSGTDTANGHPGHGWPPAPGEPAGAGRRASGAVAGLGRDRGAASGPHWP